MSASGVRCMYLYMYDAAMYARSPSLELCGVYVNRMQWSCGAKPCPKILREASWRFALAKESYYNPIGVAAFEEVSNYTRNWGIRLPNLNLYASM